MKGKWLDTVDNVDEKQHQHVKGDHPSPRKGENYLFVTIWYYKFFLTDLFFTAWMVPMV